MISIFSYTDYRKYLADALMEHKRVNPHFSYRFIARRLDLKSAAFFNFVVTGRKKLPEVLVPKIADLFKLNEKEREYFSLLVKFNHCGENGEREELLRRLDGLKRGKRARHLQPDHYRIFTQWYYVAIRELLRIIDFTDDYHDLATSLEPKITTREARAAIRTLERIGLIVRGDDGILRPVESQITTGEAWESELIKSLQIRFADMGKNAIITVPRHRRDFSNLTFCASEATMRRISRDITLLRQKILSMVDDDSAADTVYQCNLQLFPIGHKRRGTDE
jgi:uncharacterized protein (TIGR02147 family)